MQKEKLFEKIILAIIVLSLGLAGFNESPSFPYDDKYFEAAERIVFIAPQEASLNIIPKEGKNLDIKFYLAENQIDVDGSVLDANPRSFYGLNDSLEIPILLQWHTSRFHYKIEYKESKESAWRSTPKRSVNVPGSSSKTKIIFISDDHYFDDAGLSNPDQSICLNNTIAQIQKENPDLIINLGDTGLAAGHRWEQLGLKSQHQATLAEIDQYEKLFRINQRKIFSALTPTVPIYWVLGNHDNEAGFNRTRESAVKYRKKYWKQPQNSSSDENYFWLMLEQRKILIAALDVMAYNLDLPRKPEDWTIGIEQKQRLKEILKSDADWKFVCGHHVLGGWPSGSTEDEKTYAYGRGPLFTENDYRGFCSDTSRIEQVELTKIMLDNGVDAFIYGHDHIFHSKNIGVNFRGRILRGICVGSPKYIGELNWYKGAYWREFYGNFGKYGDYDDNRTHQERTDFWGPSGYVKLTIIKGGAEIEYIRSAYHSLTNIPPFIQNGDCIQRIVF